MKTIFLLRHAKSSWDDASQPDHERPLNKRGKKTAPRMGRFLANEVRLPDLIIASPAIRARETARLIVEGSGFAGRVEIAEGLYPTTVRGCLDVLAALDAGVESVMLVAHNFGLEEFLEHLTGDSHRMSTCAVAVLELPIERWPEITSETTGSLVNLWRPRELFPE